MPESSTQASSHYQRISRIEMICSIIEIMSYLIFGGLEASYRHSNTPIPAFEAYMKFPSFKILFHY